MISFFTDPYEGELITHAVARYIEYEGNTVSRGLMYLSSEIGAKMHLKMDPL